LLVQGLQVVRGGLAHGCAPLTEVLSMLARARIAGKKRPGKVPGQ
jgi:hypothetical protein